MRIHETRACRLGPLLEVAVLAGLTVMLSACSRTRADQATKDPSPGAVAASVVRVSRRDLSHDLEIASEFVPYQEIDVDAKVSGYLQKLYIDWGTHVRQGQLMGVVEVPELEAEVARDEAAVQRDAQNVSRAKQELLRAQSAYEVAHLTYTRLHGVQKTQPGLVAQEEVDVARGKDAETSAAVSASEAALAAAQQQLSADRSASQRDKVMFNYARITAPFDGVVTQIYAYTGALLPAGTSSSRTALPLCHLSQANVLRLVIPVPERVVSNVHMGETVRVKVPDLNKTFQGKVTRFSGQINMDTRTMHTEVEVANPNYEIVPGMYAYVELPVESVNQALTIPIQALARTGPNQGSILVVNPNHEVEQRTVPLGVETASEVQVLSGVEEGDLVVFGGSGRFQPGEKVKPVPVKETQLLGGDQ